MWPSAIVKKELAAEHSQAGRHHRLGLAPRRPDCLKHRFRPVCCRGARGGATAHPHLAWAGSRLYLGRRPLKAVQDCSLSFPLWPGGVSNASSVSALLLGSGFHAVRALRLCSGGVRCRKGVLILGWTVADALFADCVVFGRVIRVRRADEFSAILILPGRFAGLARIYE